ncbi:MAG: hypothetical protein ABIP89_06510 [Polyangiaceae bacterium]
MRRIHALFAVAASALPLCLSFVGCGDVTEDPSDAAPEAGSDVRIRVDSAIPPVPYVPVGVKCVRGGGVDAGVADTAPPFDAGVDDAAVDADADGAADSGADADETGSGPAHLGPPQALWSGGDLLQNPTIVTISFPGDDLVDAIEDFVSSFGCTPYWQAVVGEYGVHEAIAGRPVRLTEAAPGKIDDSAIQVWLANKLEKHDPAFDPPTPDSLYAIYYPAETVITEGGAQSCQQFGGYHNNLVLSDGTRVAYAVMPRCSSFDSLSGIDALTGTSSHEFAEAVTDPYPSDAPAYQSPDDDHFIWGVLIGGEVGDLCVNVNERAFFSPVGYPFFVQRTWSNVSALSGHDPCVPNAPGAYFQAVPRLTDDVVLSGFGQTIHTKGVIIGVGGSKVIDLNLFSDAPTSAWTVGVHDAAGYLGLPPSLTFSLDKSSGNDGDTIHLTIFKNSANADLGAEPFEITSRQGPRTNTYFGLVGH